MSVATLPAPPAQIKPIDFSLNRRPQIECPGSAGEQFGGIGIHAQARLDLLNSLRSCFSSRSDIYAAADMSLYHQEGKPQVRTAPDLMVIKGVPNQEQRISETWDGGVMPCTIFEITSRSTFLEDTIEKALLYAQLGVAEYFLFDPEGNYFDERFIGYRLEDGLYEAIIADANGAITSEELGLTFRPEGCLLRVSAPIIGEQISTIDEVISMAKQEAARAEQEAARAAAAEAEVARLKALLAQR